MALAAGVLVFACSEQAVPTEPIELPSQVVEGFVLHENASGERLYTLEAETAYVYDPEERVEVLRPNVRFYDAKGEVHATLVAERGSILSRTEDLVARGSVVVRTADSTVLRTDSLVWRNPVRLVRTDAWVEIETPKGRVEGQGLVSDAGLTRIEILSEVTGTSDYEFVPKPDSE